MKIARMSRLPSGLTVLLSMCCCVTTVAAAPQNYFEQVAAGALGLAMKMGEILQTGGAARNEIGFQLPGIGMRSKTEIGMGEAIIRRRVSSEEDSDEYGRRKRSLTSDEVPDGVAATGPRTKFTKLMRNINAPCHAGGGTGGTGGAGDGGDGAEDIVDEARRRMARRKARLAAAGKKSTSSKSKKSSGRRRRQTEAADLEGLAEGERAPLGEEFRAHMQQFTERMNRAYEHIASSVMEAMKRMEDNFYADDDKS